MVCGLTYATLKDDAITTKTFHPGRSIGDGNKIACDPYTRTWVGSPTNPCETAESVSRDEKFETGQDNSAGGARGSIVHKMQRPRAQQGPLSIVCELVGRGRANAIRNGGTSKAKCNVYIMVRDLLDRRKAHHR